MMMTRKPKMNLENVVKMIGLTIHIFTYFLVSIASASPTSYRSSEDITLDLDELARLGDKEKMLATIRKLAGALHANCGVKEVPDMKRVYLKNTTVTCNDGSPAGYYIRKSYGSTRWVVFLDGGWYCFDRTSCRGRWQNMKHFMSSKDWAPTKKGRGILSENPEENPFLYNANMVFIPYCSSDTWSGTLKASNKDDFSFMGALILEEVIKDILPQGLSTATRMFLAGSSAGGTGVLLNLDSVADIMAAAAPTVDVRGIADSGWFLDNSQYRSIECTDALTCAPTEGIRKGIALWQGRVPGACKQHYQASEHWRCYFGYRIYPTMKTPVFVVQHLFDEAQITVDNVGAPVKKEQWQYIHHMGTDLKTTLLNVSAVFAPACLSHIVLTRSEWQKVAIDGVTLPQALSCWEGSDNEKNHYVRGYSMEPFRSRSRNRNGSVRDRFMTGIIPGPDDKLLGDDPKSNAHKRRLRRRRNRKRRGRRRQERLERQRQCELERQRKHNRGKRSLLFDIHERHHMEHHRNECNHHLVDHCAWPQCNLSCPKIRNPFTGEEMDFIDLLMQFGLDLSSIANALGMDLPTLQSMDHDVLLQLLTQQH